VQGEVKGRPARKEGTERGGDTTGDGRAKERILHQEKKVGAYRKVAQFSKT